MHGREKKSVQDFGGKSQRRETTQKTEALTGGWNQNGSSRDWLEGVECIQLAQDRERWQAVVNTVMNLWVLVPHS
jgi:hypothetical protein